MDQKYAKPAVVCLLLLSVMVGPSPIGNVRAAESQTTKKLAATYTTPKIGGIAISGEPTMNFLQNIKTQTLDVDLRSPKLMITSARYDIAAPHILLTVKAGLVRTGTATGGAEVHIRNPEEKQHSTLTCSTANYFGASSTDPAHLHLAGPVHAVLYDPQLAQPLDTIAESCEVILMPDGTNKIVLVNGGATVTPIEPAPKSKL